MALPSRSSLASGELAQVSRSSSDQHEWQEKFFAVPLSKVKIIHGLRPTSIYLCKQVKCPFLSIQSYLYSLQTLRVLHGSCLTTCLALARESDLAKLHVNFRSSEIKIDFFHSENIEILGLSMYSLKFAKSNRKIKTPCESVSADIILSISLSPRNQRKWQEATTHPQKIFGAFLCSPDKWSLTIQCKHLKCK